MIYSDFTPSMIREIANTQATIFEYAKASGCNMNSFIYNYMNSAFCNNEMDSEYSYFHGKPDTVCFAHIANEFEPDYSPDVTDIADPSWLGFMYRYLVFVSKLPSREIIKKISPEQLDNFSIAYDNFSYEEAARDIWFKIEKGLLDEQD